MGRRTSIAQREEDVARLRTFVNTRPESPANIAGWLKACPYFDQLASNGLGDLLGVLLEAVLRNTPTDVLGYLLAKLGPSDGAEGAPAVEPEGGALPHLASHDVKFRTTESALVQYITEKRVLDHFAAIIETAIAELPAEGIDPKEWLLQYLERVTKFGNPK